MCCFDSASVKVKVLRNVSFFFLQWNGFVMKFFCDLHWERYRTPHYFIFWRYQKFSKMLSLVPFLRSHICWFLRPACLLQLHKFLKSDGFSRFSRLALTYKNKKVSIITGHFLVNFFRNKCDQDRRMKEIRYFRFSVLLYKTSLMCPCKLHG